MPELEVRPEELPALADLFDPGHVPDPYPAYEQWRARSPIVRPQERLFVLSRFDDCEAVLADPTFGHFEPGQNRNGQNYTGQDNPGTVGRAEVRSMLRLNPPDHTRLRRLVSRAFTARTVMAMAPRIKAITAELLADVGPRFDLIDALALPLPVRVISELLGIPAADQPLLVRWSAVLSRTLDPGFLISRDARAEMRQAGGEFREYLSALIPRRRERPGDDLVSALVHVHDEDGTLTEEEIITTSRLLLIAGHETTRSLIGAGVQALLAYPQQLRILADNPGLIDQAVEEILRYDPPVQILARVALKDTALGSITIPSNSITLMLIGAANRDPALCDSPGTFDISRSVRRHLAFGHGIHFCLGAPLARLEATIALRQLLPMLSGLRVAGAPEWKPHTVLRGLEHLWLAEHD
jgi:cytochrome P450